VEEVAVELPPKRPKKKRRKRKKRPKWEEVVIYLEVMVVAAVIIRSTENHNKNKTQKLIVAPISPLTPYLYSNHCANHM
jgi:hypothetical protein